MTKMVNIDGLKDRQREIRTEIEKLQSEYEEIEAAVRVVMRYAVPAPVAPPAAEMQQEPTAKLGPLRPEGIPTNYEMAQIILRDAADDGKLGLTASEMVEAIGRRWWPGIQGPQILPIMYQFVKRGRLLKGEGGLFRLPNMDEAPASAEAPNNPGEHWEQTGAGTTPEEGED